MAFIPRETKRCYLVLSNYGKNGASIKRFRIDHEIPLIKGASDCSFFDGTVIAPGQSIKTLTIDQEENMQEIQYAVTIDYEDVAGNNSYSEKYTLIQQYARESSFVSTNRSNASKSENALMDISNSLDTIKTSLL